MVSEELPPPPSWGLTDVWIALGLYVFLAFLGAAIVLAVPDNPEAKAWALVAAVVLPWVGLAGWPIYATTTRGGGPVLDLRLRATPADLVFGAIAGFVALVMAGIVALGLERVTGEPLESSVGQLADDLTAASPWPVVALALLAGIGAPLVEELAFRGLLYGSLEKRGRTVIYCVAVSSVTFAAFHLEPIRFPVLLVIGLVLGFVRARTNSTGASMVAHMTNNLPGAIALLVLAFR